MGQNEEKKKTSQPTHRTPTCGGQMYGHARGAPFRVQKVDLNKSQLMLPFFSSGPAAPPALSALSPLSPSPTRLFRRLFR